jgi:hypothetical protein
MVLAEIWLSSVSAAPRAGGVHRSGGRQSKRVLVSREFAGRSIDPHSLIACAWPVIGHARSAPGRSRDLATLKSDVCGRSRVRALTVAAVASDGESSSTAARKYGNIHARFLIWRLRSSSLQIVGRPRTSTRNVTTTDRLHLDLGCAAEITAAAPTKRIGLMESCFRARPLRGALG